MDKRESERMQDLVRQADRYFSVLVKISKAYMTTEQLIRRAKKEYGVEYCEALEMAYDNIQADAAAAIRGMRRPKMPVEKKDDEKSVASGSVANES